MSALTILENDPSYATDPKTILEIGAGWGRMGYFFRQLNPGIKYIAADIPGALLIAETYLAKLFPDEPHLVYTKARQLKRIGRAELPNAFSFVGTHHIPNIADNTIDLTINVASFQEMEPANVALYFHEINRISRRVYVLERTVSDQTNFGHYIDMAAKLDWRLIARREPEFAPNYEEALFERPGGPPSSEPG
jgi:putative sugar O-methyltransferase